MRPISRIRIFDASQIGSTLARHISPFAAANVVLNAVGFSAACKRVSRRDCAART
jgi:hypothetical protein